MRTAPTLETPRARFKHGDTMARREFCVFAVRHQDDPFLPPNTPIVTPAYLAEVPARVAPEDRDARARQIVGKRLSVHPDTLVARYIVNRTRRVTR